MEDPTKNITINTNVAFIGSVSNTLCQLGLSQMLSIIGAVSSVKFLVRNGPQVATDTGKFDC